MKSWNIEETNHFNINDKVIFVKSLPEELQFDIVTYDMLRQEYMDCLYEQQKLKLAVESKLNEIKAKVVKFIIPTEDAPMENINEN